MTASATLSSEIDFSKCMSINVGVLGHVDSGKTSLCKALTAVPSTACHDKHPQSQQRGITLDLGFSAFFGKTRKTSTDDVRGETPLQFCLVDCPGHSSLIRTVIGGASIIDICLLVIDATKGIQTQTAECIVIAEILAKQVSMLNSSSSIFLSLSSSLIK
jgi:selenocysteine-specific elongation factor